jgi:hypothetical protein
MISNFCSKELEEYQENLNKQIDEISNCINKKDLTDKEKKECVMNYLEKITNPLIKCSSKKKIKKNKRKMEKNNSRKKIEKKELDINPIIEKKLVDSRYIVKEKNIKKDKQISDNLYLKINLGRLEQPLSVENIGLYINDLKEKENKNQNDK